LAALQKLAKKLERRDLWDIFRKALRDELGLDDYADEKVPLHVPAGHLAAHLALEEIIGARLDPKPRRILQAMKPYTKRHQAALEWAEKAGAEETGWSTAGPDGLQIGRKGKR
jgi:hypothetical protein